MLIKSFNEFHQNKINRKELIKSTIEGSELRDNPGKYKGVVLGGGTKPVDQVNNEFYKVVFSFLGMRAGNDEKESFFKKAMFK